jgi:hypothetical protein
MASKENQKATLSLHDKQAGWYIVIKECNAKGVCADSLG